MISANTYLADRTIRRAVYIERLKTGQVRRLMNILNRDVLPAIDAQLYSRLARLDGQRFKPSDARLAALRKAIGDILDDGAGKLYAAAAQSLRELAMAEAHFVVTSTKAAIPVAVDFISPSPGVLRQLVTKSPFEGDLLKEWFFDLSRRHQRLISKAINAGLVQGESIPQLVRRIRGTSEAAFGDGTAGEIRRNVEAVARTATQHVVTGAREETFRANEDVIKGVQIVSALDTRVCETCMAQDGEVYDVGEGQRPPFHWNCRCTVVPVLKSWKELGFDLKELEPGARASMNGQVAGTTTYGEWLKRQPAAVQDEVLGQGKAKLFRGGQVEIDQFVDDRGRPLTLKQLKALDQ